MPEPKELTLAELNALVAEKLDIEIPKSFSWSPTTDWRDAGRVIDRMRELGWRLHLAHRDDGPWVAHWRKSLPVPLPAIAKKAQRAICLAALAARTGERYSVKEE